MKSRADCLNEYGSGYMIQQKVEVGELFKVAFVLNFSRSGFYCK